MREYVKKPIPVGAFQWDGRLRTLKQNMPAKDIHNYINEIRPKDHALIIQSLEGHEVCKINNIVIRGIHGEYYPCNYNVFKESYQLFDPKEGK